MKKLKKRYRFIFFLNIAIIVAIIAYKLYLNIFNTQMSSQNVEACRIITETLPYNDFSFAVVGNAENSINIFNNRIAPSLNHDTELSFAVSCGNAVINGNADKYRILRNSLERLNIPFIVSVGANEVEGAGIQTFYRDYGPLYFTFNAGGACFVFLDTTGLTPHNWQISRLNADVKGFDGLVFVFMDGAVYKSDSEQAARFREFFESVPGVIVFCSERGVYDKREINGVTYYSTGGGGGRLNITAGESVYHYLKVIVKNGGVQVELVPQGGVRGSLALRYLERTWITIHAFFYANITDFLLVLCLFILLAFVIHIKSSKATNYYRTFSEAENSFNREKLTIAMFTNNYFPFVGGVPISITRLAKGLRALGHTVYIFCPTYAEGYPDDEFTIRCPMLGYVKTKVFTSALVNIFTKRIEELFIKHDFDVIHVHHPFWMGKKGLEFGNNYNLPVVLTYHTRFDSYYHYMPILKTFFKNYWSHWIVRRFSQRCNAIIAPAQTSKEYLTNIGVSRHIEVVPTGVDFENFENVPQKEQDEIKQTYAQNGELLICSVSRLAEEKNIFFLLEAVKYCKEHTYAPFKCVIIGEGPERGKIEAFIKDEDLKNTVILTGNVPPARVAAFYKVSELFVFASKSETQGMVIQEAMAGKCAVVAVASSGVSDAVTDGYNGYKTPADVPLFAGQIIALLENAELRMQMRENAFLSARGFSVEVMAEKAAEVYKAAALHKKTFGTFKAE